GRPRRSPRRLRRSGWLEGCRLLNPSFSSGRRYELSIRIVAVDYKLRVGAAAQLVQVHADALAVWVDAEGRHAVEQPEEQIDERQHQAQQGGNTHQLGQK